MSKKTTVSPQLPCYPRAPPLNEFDDNLLMQRTAPPSYDESIRQQANYPIPTQYPTHTMYSYQNPVPVYGGYPHYAAPPATANSHVPVPPGGQAYTTLPQNAPILELAKGASIRTTPTGAISIPPPPPGCAPTPAQLAAMQGKSVLVKEPKKRSFFSF